MSVTIKISRLSNFLFFIKRKKRYSDRNIEVSLYGDTDSIIWKQIKNANNVNKFESLKKNSICLESDFSEYWRKSSKHLASWKQYIEKNQKLLDKVVSKIKKLVGIKNFPISKIPVYLVSDPRIKYKEIDVWFSWTPKESFIVVEIPFVALMPTDLFNLGALAHEFFHLMLRKNNDLFSKMCEIAQKNEKLIAQYSDGMPSRLFLEELIVSSFIPEGYMSEKYLDIKMVKTGNPKNLLEWRKFVADKSYKVVREYINDSKQIDEKYLEGVVNIIRRKK